MHNTHNPPKKHQFHFHPCRNNEKFFLITFFLNTQFFLMFDLKVHCLLILASSTNLSKANNN